MDQELLIQNIINELQSLDLQQLKTVLKAIEALHSNSEERLHNMGRLLGIEWNEHGDAYMKLGAFNANAYGVAQGGAVYTLADVAIGYRIMKQLKENQKVFTIEMKMNFIKKGQGTRLTAKTEIIHWGKRTVVAQCQVLDETADIVAQSLGTFMIVED